MTSNLQTTNLVFPKFFSVWAVEKETKLFIDPKLRQNLFWTNKNEFSFSTANTEKNSWKNWGNQDYLFGGLISRTRYCKFLELCRPNCSMGCLKNSFHLWKVVLVFAEKQGWGNFILKGLDRTVSIMVVQTSFLKSAFDPGIMTIWVIKFPRVGYKIRQILGQKSTYLD